MKQITNITKKIISVLALSVLTLNAGLVDSLYSTSCSEYLTQDENKFINQSSTKKKANIGPICLNIKHHLEMADAAQGIKKFIHLKYVQAELNKMVLFGEKLGEVENVIDTTLDQAYDELLKNGYILASDKNVVEIKLEQLSNEEYKLTKYVYDKNGIHPNETPLSIVELVKAYPKMALDYNIYHDEVNMHHSNSDIQKSNGLENNTYIINGSTVNCRDYPLLKHSNVLIRLKDRTKVKVVNDKFGMVSSTSGFILIWGAKNKPCWVSQNLLSEEDYTYDVVD